MELRRARGAQRGVERVLHAVVEVVLADARAAVDRPVGRGGGQAADPGHVGVVVGGDRPIALRVDGGDVGGVARVAEERAALAVAVGVGGERIRAQAAAQRQAGVVEQVAAVLVGVARLEQHAAVERLVGRRVVLGGVRRARGARPVGALAVLHVATEMEEAVVAERQALVGADGDGLAVGDVAAVGRELRVVGADGDGRGAARGRALEAEVDHAGHRVAAVLRAGAVAQHLDGVDGRGGQRIDVHRDGAGEQALGVHHGADVAPLAVDQHQRLVGRQAAQLDRAHRVGGAAGRHARHVDGGIERLQRLAHVAGAERLGQLRAGEQVDRHGAVEHGAVAGPRAGDHHLLRRVGGGGLGRGRSGRRRRRGLRVGRHRQGRGQRRGDRAGNRASCACGVVDRRLAHLGTSGK